MADIREAAATKRKKSSRENVWLWILTAVIILIFRFDA
jgi:hypothetical protein